MVSCSFPTMKPRTKLLLVMWVGAFLTLGDFGSDVFAELNFMCIVAVEQGPGISCLNGTEGFRNATHVWNESIGNGTDSNRLHNDASQCKTHPWWFGISLTMLLVANVIQAFLYARGASESDDFDASFLWNFILAFLQLSVILDLINVCRDNTVETKPVESENKEVAEKLAESVPQGMFQGYILFALAVHMNPIRSASVILSIMAFAFGITMWLDSDDENVSLFRKFAIFLCLVADFSLRICAVACCIRAALTLPWVWAELVVCVAVSVASAAWAWGSRHVFDMFNSALLYVLVNVGALSGVFADLKPTLVLIAWRAIENLIFIGTSFVVVRSCGDPLIKETIVMLILWVAHNSLVVALAMTAPIVDDETYDEDEEESIAMGLSSVASTVAQCLALERAHVDSRDVLIASGI